MEIEYRSFDRKKERYRYILEQAERILDEAGTEVAAMANLSATLKLLMPRVNWAGFYLARGDGLSLGPFQGKPAVSSIKTGMGVCGTALATLSPQVVGDVHCCENHIACDLSSRSEIVVPIVTDGGIYGVLDIDSPDRENFDTEDLEGLTALCALFARFIDARAVGNK